MNIELTDLEVEVIKHALLHLNGHNSKLLDPAYAKREQCIDLFGEGVFETAKNEWEIVNKILFPKFLSLEEAINEQKPNS